MKIVLILRNPTDAKQSGYWFNRNVLHRSTGMTRTTEGSGGTASEFKRWVQANLKLLPVTEFSKCHLAHANESASSARQACGSPHSPSERHHRKFTTFMHGFSFSFKQIFLVLKRWQCVLSFTMSDSENGTRSSVGSAGVGSL